MIITHISYPCLLFINQFIIHPSSSASASKNNQKLEEKKEGEVGVGGVEEVEINVQGYPTMNYYNWLKGGSENEGESNQSPVVGEEGKSIGKENRINYKDWKEYYSDILIKKENPLEKKIE